MPNRKRSITTMTILASSVLCGLQAQITARDKTHLQPEKSRLLLVELFTSEGCSSCPPADALLRQVNGMQTNSGQIIVGISEHVTYWNDLGWSDPFSSDAYTERQYAYGQRFHLESVYTPQIIIDGKVQITGSDRAALLLAIHEDQMPQPVFVHLDAIHIRDHALTIDFSVKGIIPKGGVDLFAAITDDNTRSSVTRGENSGHTLTHVSVAQSITRIAKLSSPTVQTIQIPLPNPTALSTHQGRHLILFAQLPELGPILGVDTKGF